EPLSVISLIVLIFYFFFFQAEDGIRDRNVTGVQTCALPIFVDGRIKTSTLNIVIDYVQANDDTGNAYFGMDNIEAYEGWSEDLRSEERRVGKECRSRREPCAERKKGESKDDERKKYTTKEEL